MAAATTLRAVQPSHQRTLFTFVTEMSLLAYLRR